MALRPASTEPRPLVRVPSAREDQPAWVRVGVIAAVGFVVGIAWPRVMGVRLGPSLPEVATEAVAPSVPVASAPSAPSSVASSAPSAPSSVASSAPSAPSSVASSAPAPSSEPVTAGTVDVSVGHGAVVSCKTPEGDTLKGAECGVLTGFDAVVVPRLRKLAGCPSASSSLGKLRLGVTADFARGSLWVEARGHASDDPLSACVRSHVAGASLAGIAHDHPKYTVAYSVVIGGHEPLPAAAASVPAETGSLRADEPAQVVWDVAIVRDAPKSGKVVARLQRGAALHVGPAKDGWYPVKYGDGYANEGWVYRGAIGR